MIKKISGRSGFSLTELLAATLIMLLATGLLTQTMALAVRHFYRSVQISEAELLCSTLSIYVESELAYAKNVEVPGSAEGAIMTFDSEAHNMGPGASFQIKGMAGAPSGCGRLVETSVIKVKDDSSVGYYDIAGMGSYTIRGSGDNTLYAGMTVEESGKVQEGVTVTICVKDRDGTLLAENKMYIPFIKKSGTP